MVPEANPISIIGPYPKDLTGVRSLRHIHTRILGLEMRICPSGLPVRLFVPSGIRGCMSRGRYQSVPLAHPSKVEKARRAAFNFSAQTSEAIIDILPVGEDLHFCNVQEEAPLHRPLGVALGKALLVCRAHSSTSSTGGLIRCLYWSNGPYSLKGKAG